MLSLERKIRSYEYFLDREIPEGFYRIVRLDGRNFHKLSGYFVKPYFDKEFSEGLELTTAFLMQHSGFKIAYGYTQSDEISLLLSKVDDSFGNRPFKIVSVLSGEASSFLTEAWHIHASFDARLICLPNSDLILDYFKWRKIDAVRNALNSFTFWTLVEKMGYSNKKANSFLKGKKGRELNEILFQAKRNITNILPRYRFGIAFYWVEKKQKGYNPITKQATNVIRHKLHTDFDLTADTSYIPKLEDLLKQRNEI